MFAAVVLAGGAARRLGGTSKPGRTVGGVRLLDRVLAALAGADPLIVVGPPELLLPPGARRTLESPPGGGPVAGVAAGLALIPGEASSPPALVAVLASDLPFVTAATVASLRAAVDAGDQDGAVLLDDAGRRQWLCGVWRRDALNRRVAEIGDPTGWGWRQLADGLRVAEVPPDAVTGAPAWFDCDTEADIRQAQEWIDGQPR